MNNSQNKTQGIIYAAKGEKCLREFSNSYSSLRQCMPDVEVSLITDIDVKVEGARVINLPVKKINGQSNLKGFFYKTCAARISPYGKTILLDCDTYVIKSLSPLFNLVDNFDICASLSPYDRVWPKIGDSEAVGYLPVNSGVLAFSESEKSVDIIKGWGNILEKKIINHSARKKEGDQTSLNESILNKKGRLCVLPNNFNARIFSGNARKNVPCIIEGEVYVLHTHEIIEGGQISELINKTESIRSISIKDGKVIVKKF